MLLCLGGFTSRGLILANSQHGSAAWKHGLQLTFSMRTNRNSCHRQFSHMSQQANEQEIRCLYHRLAKSMVHMNVSKIAECTLL